MIMFHSSSCHCQPSCRPPLPAPLDADGNESGSSNALKYRARNPAARWLLRRFLNRIAHHTEQLRPRRIVDLGAGEGQVAAHLVDSLSFDFEYRGLEIKAPSVSAARARYAAAARCREDRATADISFEHADILVREPDKGWADLALCLEVIEHLTTPRRAVERMHQWTHDVAVVSVPWEPYFQLMNFARGKYLRTLGNHPEHVQHFSPRQLRELLQSHFEAVQVETCFPWIIAIARRVKPDGKQA